MTLAQLRTLVQDLVNKTDAVGVAQANLRAFLETITVGIAPGPVSSVLDQADIDEIITAQTPLYNALLTALETATDALGTDAFH